jgi:hypothetical protein
MGITAALVALLALAVFGPANAVAATAEISKASISSDGSRITIAGSVTWTGCEIKFPKPPPPGPEEEGGEESPPPDNGPAHCGWTPFATVGAGSDPAECSLPGRERPEALDSGVTLAWEGSESDNAGTVKFEVADLPINGGSTEVVCLGLIEKATDFPYYQVGPRLLASALAATEPNAGAPTLQASTVGQSGSTKPRHRRHRHRVKRRHRGISLAQHVAVSKN